MMKNKIILPTVFALSVLVIGILATSNAKAQQNYPTIVTKLAQRFNLKIEDVEEVFDEERDERRAEMFARFSERLDELVSQGKITSAQKETILDKHEEMRDKMDELSGLSLEERRDKMREIHDEFKSWLNQQDLDSLGIGSFGQGFKKGIGMGRMMGASN